MRNTFPIYPKRVMMFVIVTALTVGFLATSTSANANPLEIDQLIAPQNVSRGSDIGMAVTLNRRIGWGESVEVYQDNVGIAGCGMNWTFCPANGSAPWANNEPGVTMIRVDVRANGVITDTRAVPITISPVDFALAFEPGLSFVYMGRSTSVSATVAGVNLMSTPYYIHIQNTDTGATVAKCKNSTGFCSYVFNAPWEGIEGNELHLTAFVAPMDGTPFVSRVENATIILQAEIFRFHLATNPNPVGVGQPATINATLLNDELLRTPFYMHIVDERSGLTIAKCRNASNSCSANIGIDWFEEVPEEEPLFTVYLASYAGYPIQNYPQSIPVEVAKPPVEIAMGASQSTLAPGESAIVGATLTSTNVMATPFYLHIKDERSGQILARCRNSSSYCSAQTHFDWTENGSPEDRRLSAFLAPYEGSPIFGEKTNLEIPVDPVEFEIDLSTSKQMMKPGESATVSAQVINTSVMATPFHLHIRDDRSGEIIASCRNSSNSCSANFSVDWSENIEPEDRSFSAFLAPQSGSPITSGVEETTVGIEPIRFKLEADVTPEVISIPDSGSVGVQLTEGVVVGTPYSIVIENEYTGDVVATCKNVEGYCSYQVTTGWDDNVDPDNLAYTAYVASDNHVASDEIEVGFGLDQRLFDVKLDVLGRADEEDPVPLAVRATSDPSVLNTPYSLKIKDIDSNETIESCVNFDLPGTVCPDSLGAGTYRASVEDENGNVLGQSESILINGDGSTSDTNLGGVDVQDLAVAFKTVDAVCDALLVAPYKTHLMSPPSTLSDQYRVCLNAKAAGKDIRQTLLLALGGSAIGSLLAQYLATYGPEIIDAIEVPEFGWIDAVLPNGEVVVDSSFEIDFQSFWDRNKEWIGKRAGIREAKIAFMACLATGLVTACKTKPVIFPGRLLTPETTEHTWDAQRIFNPVVPYYGWTRLVYDTRKKDTKWKHGFPECAGRSTSTPCDEFPYLSSEQGGEPAAVRPSLRLVPQRDNSIQGAALRWFYRWCGVKVSPSREYFVVPMPESSETVTFPACNPTSTG